MNEENKVLAYTGRAKKFPKNFLSAKTRREENNICIVSVASLRCKKLHCVLYRQKDATIVEPNRELRFLSFPYFSLGCDWLYICS